MYCASVAVSTSVDAIYVTGDTPDDNTDDNVYYYNINTDHWTMLPQPGHRFGVLHMLDDQLTIFGGYDPVTHNALNKVTTYNNDTKTWHRQYPDVLNIRFKPGVITYHNYVIVMGGISSLDTIHDNIEVMEYRHELEWKETSLHLPVPMWAIKPTISGDNIIVVGYSGTEGCNNRHYQITIDEIISSFNQPLSTGAVSTKWKKCSPATHWKTATVPYSNPPVIVGGESREHIPTSDVMLYDASKKSWRKIDSLTSARQNVGVALLNNRTIILNGGSTEGPGVKEAMASSLTTVEIGYIIPNH